MLLLGGKSNSYCSVSSFYATVRCLRRHKADRDTGPRSMTGGVAEPDDLLCVLDLDRPAQLSAVYPQQRQARGRDPSSDPALAIGEPRQPRVALRRRAASAPRARSSLVRGGSR